MEIRPEDLKIEAMRWVGGGCGVRITQVPTGTSAYAVDEDTISANRELALARLSQALDDED